VTDLLFQAEDGIRGFHVTGVQTCALPIYIAAGNVRPTVTLYQADAVINWRMVRRGARSVLGLVVIKEVAEEWDGFDRSEVDQYRSEERRVGNERGSLRCAYE